MHGPTKCKARNPLINCLNTRHAKSSSNFLLFGPSRYTCSFDGMIGCEDETTFGCVLSMSKIEVKLSYIRKQNEFKDSKCNCIIMRIISYNVNGIRAAMNKGL